MMLAAPSDGQSCEPDGEVEIVKLDRWFPGGFAVVVNEAPSRSYLAAVEKVARRLGEFEWV
jgi:hypothetical protein